MKHFIRFFISPHQGEHINHLLSHIQHQICDWCRRIIIMAPIPIPSQPMTPNRSRSWRHPSPAQTHRYGNNLQSLALIGRQLRPAAVNGLVRFGNCKSNFQKHDSASSALSLEFKHRSINFQLGSSSLAWGSSMTLWWGFTHFEGNRSQRFLHCFIHVQMACHRREWFVCVGGDGFHLVFRKKWDKDQLDISCELALVLLLIGVILCQLTRKVVLTPLRFAWNFILRGNFSPFGILVPDSIFRYLGMEVWYDPFQFSTLKKKI